MELATRSQWPARLVLVALSGAGCEVAPAQLLVVVNTDLAVPGEVDEVRIRVWSPGQAEPREDRSLSLTDTPDQLPASFGVAPRDGDVSRRVTVTADALLGGAEVVATSAATTFLERKVLRVDLFLARECLDRECLEGETCRAGVCEDLELDPEDLHVYEPGEDLGPPPPRRVPEPVPWPTVLLPMTADTEIRNLDLDVAPDGAAVIVGSFRGTVVLGEEVSSGDWAGFVARYERDGTARYRQLLLSAGGEAFVNAVAVSSDDTTWISAACERGDVSLERVGESPGLNEDCLLSTAYEWPLDPDGATGQGIEWALGGAAVELRAHIDANETWVASALWEPTGISPTFSRGPPGGMRTTCSLTASAIRPVRIALDPTGALWVAGGFEGTIDNPPLEALRGTDGLLALVDVLDPTCAMRVEQAPGTDGEDEALGLAVEADRWAMVGRNFTGNGFVLASEADFMRLLEGSSEDLLEDVAAAPEGQWVVAGWNGPDALLSGVPIEPLGRRDGVVAGLDEILEVRWLLVLGGPDHDDEARGVEIDPTTGDILVLGLTTGPSNLDPLGTLAAGERAIFLHRFAPP